MASREKNPSVINATPIHIHFRHKARPNTLTSAAGRKSWTSPISFMARETQSSPATCDHDQRKEEHFQHLWILRGAWIGAPNDEDAKANDSNTGPANRRNDLAKQQSGQQGDDGIRHRRGRLDKAVIRP